MNQKAREWVRKTELWGVSGLKRSKKLSGGMTFVVLMQKALKQAQNHMKQHLDSAATKPGWILE